MILFYFSFKHQKIGMIKRLNIIGFFLLISLQLICCINETYSKSELSFYISIDDTSKIKSNMFEISFTDGKQSKTISDTNFNDNENGYYIASFTTESTGDLEATFVLSDSLEDSISFGKINLSLKPDWIWGISFYITPKNPCPISFGCFGSISFELKEAYRDTIIKNYTNVPIEASYAETLFIDSLYLLWSGNSISNPRVY